MMFQDKYVDIWLGKVIIQQLHVAVQPEDVAFAHIY